MEIHGNQIIDGRFRIIQPNFKSGGFGSIHIAVDANGRKLALKFPLKKGIQKDLEAFKKEYQNILRFNHPNVAKALHFGEHEGNFFIAFEFIDGTELRTATRSLPPAEMMPFFIQALQGLEAIHKEPMLHLDIKSSNILVSNDKKVHIIDFGLADVIQELAQKEVCGTPSYIAPETILRKKIDQRTDIFSMGVAMYYCVAGVYPYKKRASAGKDKKALKAIIVTEEKETPPPPSHYNISVPKWMDDIILTMIAYNPEERFPTVRAVINALQTRHPENYKGSPEAIASYLLPKGNGHIGHEAEQKMVLEQLTQLTSNKQPEKAIFWIVGDREMGKSHFLKKIKEVAERDAEKISILCLELPSSPLKSMTENRQEWITQWENLLKTKIAENKQPLLVLIDNADHKNLQEILQNLSTRISERINHPELYSDMQSILLCCTAKTAPQSDNNMTIFYLKPFGHAEIKSYLQSTPALAQKKIPDEWVETLYNQTAGNPRELKERLLAIDSHGLLFDIDGNIISAQVEEDSVDFVEEEPIPTSTQKRLETEWTRLSSHEQEILEAMAVYCYKDFILSTPFSDLKVFFDNKNYLLSVLNALVSLGLLTHDKKSDSYAFHPGSYLPVLIYQKMEPSKRRHWHQKMSIHCTGRHDVALLHRGYGFEGSEGLKALLHLAQDQLSKEGQTMLAKQILDQALTLAPADNLKLQVFLRGRWIEALCYSAHYEDAIATYEETLKNIKAQNNFPASLLGRLTAAILPAFIEKQDFQKAEREINETLEYLVWQRQENSYLVPLLRNFLAKILYKKYFTEVSGDKMHLLEKAKDSYEKNALRESLLLSHQQNLVRNNDLGLVLHTLGDNQKAAGILKNKQSRLQHNPNIFIEFVTVTTLAEACRMLKKYSQAHDYAEIALKMAQKTSQGKWILYAHYIMAGIEHAMGISFQLKKQKKLAQQHFQTALKENSCCLAASICLQDQREAAANALNILVRKAQCYEDMGDWDAALSHFKAAFDYQSTGIFLPLIYAGLGEAYVHKNNMNKAKEFLDKARPLLATLPQYIAVPYQFKILKAETTLHLKEGFKDKAQECLNKMQELARQDEELQIEYEIFSEEMAGEVTL